MDQCIPVTGSEQSSLQGDLDGTMADAGDAGDSTDDSQQSNRTKLAENPPDPGTVPQSDDALQDLDLTTQPVGPAASDQDNGVEIAQVASGSNVQDSTKGNGNGNENDMQGSEEVGPTSDQLTPSILASGSSESDQSRPNNNNDNNNPSNPNLDTDAAADANLDLNSTPQLLSSSQIDSTPSAPSTSDSSQPNDLNSDSSFLSSRRIRKTRKNQKVRRVFLEYGVEVDSWGE